MTSNQPRDFNQDFRVSKVRIRAAARKPSRTMATGMNMATTDIIEIKPICYSDSNSLNYFLAGRDKQDS